VQEHITSMQGSSLHSAQDLDQKICTFWQDRSVQICGGSGMEMSDSLSRILVLLLVMILIYILNES
jgi:hypothetical protein